MDWEKKQQQLHPVRLSPEQCDITPQLHLTPVPAAEHFHEWLFSKLSDLDLSFEMSLLLYSMFQCATQPQLFFLALADPPRDQPYRREWVRL